jgi:L-methionine (R)-S-oxide reductase
MIPAPLEKENLFRLSREQLAVVLEDETDPIAIMASVVSVLKKNLPHVCWVGFYRVDLDNPDELVVGPYQGLLGTLRVTWGRGVCGTCAEAGVPVIIPDLRDAETLETCESLPVSEIALPVFGLDGILCAVLDLDSPDLDAFQDEDCEGLEAILELIRLKL